MPIVLITRTAFKRIKKNFVNMTKLFVQKMHQELTKTIVNDYEKPNVLLITSIEDSR